MLCGVSPKIGRIRTTAEPKEAAWSADGGSPATMHEQTCCQPGCKLSERTNEPDAKVSTAGELQEVLPAATDHEGNEISFNVYLELKYPHDADLRAKAMQETYDGGDYQLENDYVEWYHTKMSMETKRKEPVWKSYEHIAGPDCVDHHAYNGYAISAEEMKFCTTMQCIVLYDNEYHESYPNQWSEPDDEEFERQGVYHLTGLGDACGSWEDDCSVYPKRHGCYEVYPMAYGGFKDGDPPFHPHCLEMYRRVSALRRGTTDMTDLAHWIEHQLHEIPNHPAVDRGSHQWWAHRGGDELLAANPLHIPGLSVLLESAKREQGTFDARASPFGARSATSKGTEDLFGKLPEEIRDIIVASLGSKDVANLRLASRSFHHLPYTLWHDLMKKEMPWIWEAWSDRPYPLMSCATKRELIEHDESIKTRSEALAADDTLESEQRAIQEQLVAEDDAEFRKPRAAQQLDRLHTDWYWLYYQLQREWKNIKGLQNRERIWKVIEFVSRRIANPDEDLELAKEDHTKAFPYKDLNPDGWRR